jgi:DNA polymerase-1
MASINLQNLPSDPDFLKCLVAEPGHKLVYLDFSAVEPHVMAHFSKDPGLMALYGPNAKPNCVYLFYASQTSLFGPAIRKYYDPFNPTTESVKAAKLHCAKERQAFKPIYLGWLYGLGAGAMHESTHIPLAECKQILEDIAAATPGLKDFGDRLKVEWASNGGWADIEWIKDPVTGRNKAKFIDGRPGWIYNGRGRPLGVDPEKKKDLVNRHVQSTGSDLLKQYLMNLSRLRTGSMRPYNVDMHDATIWQARDCDVDKTVAIFKESLTILNKTLQWSVEIKGEVKVGVNLADFLD